MSGYRYLNDDFNVEKLRGLPPESLEELAAEIRDRIVSVCGLNGGHLASSLGAVDLAVALHYAFNTPEDKVIWDVGHQAYAHKILTGRNCEFSSLRKKEGISGFLKRDESDFDVYDAGHTSTSVSAAAGFCAARELKGQGHAVVAVIGDGALTGGVAFEGLNLMGEKKWDNAIVILNDNEMSIDKNVGALARYYNKAITSDFYTGVRNEIRKFLKSIPSGSGLYEFMRRSEEAIKSFIIKGAFYEDLGFTYIGPVDGHDIPRLVRYMKKCRSIKGPVLLHVRTVKGKGYGPAETDPEGYHGVHPAGAKKARRTYTKIFSGEILKLAEKDDKILALTAAMPSGTGLTKFKECFPERYFDVGIAEQSAVITATALALEGFKPFFAVYSTFLQRAYDQLIHDTGLMKAPVRFLIDRSGFVGRDGPTHHGLYDIAYLRTVPGMTLLSPRDGRDLQKMVRFMAKFESGPIAVRYPRGEAAGDIGSGSASVRYGRGELVQEGGDLLICAEGRMVREAVDCAAILSEKGLNTAVFDLRFLKPLDEDYLRTCGHRYIVTLESGTVSGGVGEAIGAFLNREGISSDVLNLGAEDKYYSHGGQDELIREAHLDAVSISDRIFRWIK